MKDYTKIPGYEKLPALTARSEYLSHLLRLYQGPGSEQGQCRRRAALGGCADCNLRRAINADAHKGVCGWAAEADPEWAILCLEELTSREKEMNIVEGT
jgi:hypothetical protein